MQRQSPSIFNDIVGPIMVGPSSSHTCAPSRIGYLCRQLVGGNLKKVRIEFARDGAYTEMYQGQRSDMGFWATGQKIRVCATPLLWQKRPAWRSPLKSVTLCP